jgi:hypothetical protein
VPGKREKQHGVKKGEKGKRGSEWEQSITVNIAFCLCKRAKRGKQLEELEARRKEKNELEEEVDSMATSSQRTQSALRRHTSFG